VCTISKAALFVFVASMRRRAAVAGPSLAVTLVDLGFVERASSGARSLMPSLG